MALIDVVKCSMGNRELVAKFPSEDLRLGTQLVVYPGQTAFFIKGGEIYDEFSEGTYTLSSGNIPLLNKIINLPFGGNSPFQAEVWFVNRIAILDSKWGTATPLQIEDPKYGVIVPVRSYGQYGFRIEDPRTFLRSLIGNMTSFTIDRLNNYFKGKIMSQLTNIISNKLTRDNISVLNINSHLADISEFCRESIAESFRRYGLVAQEFDVISISVKEDDPSFVKLKEAKDLAARIKITGRDIYQMDRSFDVLDTAAGNENTAGNLMNAGLGLGIGMNAATQMGTNLGNTMNVNPAPTTPPPLQQSVQYYLAINNQQVGPLDINTVMGYINNGTINATTLAWRQGMQSWAPIKDLPDFAHVFSPRPPALPTF